MFDRGMMLRKSVELAVLDIIFMSALYRRGYALHPSVTAAASSSSLFLRYIKAPQFGV